ncbi:MAG: carboxypeptidase-like regulatory domain-containing protein [Bacteroidales bacterium]|nr:carboxypeptidase-like regulatory domain-containing protein [Bacteroidales bacterium]
MRAGRIYLLVLFLLCSLASNGQDLLKKYIPIPPQELSVEQFLYHIQDLTGYHPAYSSLIVEDKKLAIYADSLTVKELLDTLFTNIELTYIIRDNQLILSPQSRLLQEKQMIRLSGMVKQERNNRPIPFASVFIPYKSQGTVTNSDGRFELFIPADQPVDSIIISCLGYSGKTILPGEFLRGPVEVSLVPYRYQIEELIVRPQDPKLLIQGMLDHKKDNYSAKPELFTAFFREVGQQNDNYVSLSEAVIDIYKTSYLSEGNDLIQLKKGRRGTNAKPSEIVNLVVEGGLYTTLQLDVMKYGVAFLNPEMMQHYTYTFDRQIQYNHRQTYIISFEFKENIQEPGFDGKLFIDAETLGLVRAEFDITDESLIYAYSILVRKVPKQYRVSPRFARYFVEYRFYDGKWNLNHASSEVSIRLKKKRDRKMAGYSCRFLARSEFVITGKEDQEFERIRYRDASKPTDVLYKQVTITDRHFWGNENTIIPEEPLQNTIRKLRLEESGIEGNAMTNRDD